MMIAGVLFGLFATMLAISAPVIALVLFLTSLVPRLRATTRYVLSESFFRAILAAVVFSLLNWFATYKVDPVLFFIAFGLTFTASSIYLGIKVFWKASASDRDSE